MFTKEETNTILAALRYYQHMGMCNERDQPDWLADISTNGGEHAPLDAEEVDALCEKINCPKKTKRRRVKR